MKYAITLDSGEKWNSSTGQYSSTSWGRFESIEAAQEEIDRSIEACEMGLDSYIVEVY